MTSVTRATIKPRCYLGGMLVQIATLLALSSTSFPYKLPTFMNIHRFSIVAVILASTLHQLGCASLELDSLNVETTEPEPSLRESPEAALFRAVQTARQSNAIILQVRNASKPIRIIPLPEDGRSVFVNDLLQQAGLIGRYSSLEVMLYRSDGQVMDSVKMAVTFDKRTKRVSTGTDYALRPGDRITVQSGYASALQSIVDGVIPPIARQTAKR